MHVHWAKRFRSGHLVGCVWLTNKTYDENWKRICTRSGRIEWDTFTQCNFMFEGKIMFVGQCEYLNTLKN